MFGHSPRGSGPWPWPWPGGLEGAIETGAWLNLDSKRAESAAIELIQHGSVQETAVKPIPPCMELYSVGEYCAVERQSSFNGIGAYQSAIFYSELSLGLCPSTGEMKCLKKVCYASSGEVEMALLSGKCRLYRLFNIVYYVYYVL